jgi:hypothetical protein
MTETLDPPVVALDDLRASILAEEPLDAGRPEE